MQSTNLQNEYVKDGKTAKILNARRNVDLEQIKGKILKSKYKAI